jgi:predicted HAD superfamily Cof-like phosphohydrolase
MSQFQEDIAKFNGIYKLPVASRPTLDVPPNALDRLHSFKKILLEEVEEINEVIEQVDQALGARITGDEVDVTNTELIALTSLADLLGDLQVYCASEMAKFGIPLDETLAIIMQSNFSKLGADGLPIYDERGKVMKGPNYWKPEPMIREMLAQQLLQKNDN